MLTKLSPHQKMYTNQKPFLWLYLLAKNTAGKIYHTGVLGEYPGHNKPAVYA